MNGWKNYETWNVSLWISNDERWYRMACACEDSYAEFCARMAYHGITRTPDGVDLQHPDLDIPALNQVIEEIDR
jgi:hypothetical protein